MDAFSSSPLMESFPCGAFGSPSVSPAPSPTRTEVDFPADVDQSFNSSMSFSQTDSPPAPSPSLHLSKAVDALASPTPLFALRPPRRPDVISRPPSVLGSVREGEPLSTSSRALGPGRTFGRELSLNARPPLSKTLSSQSFGKGTMLPPAVPELNPGCGSPVRLAHAMSHEDMSSPRHIMARMGRRPSAPLLESPRVQSSMFGGGMDIDSPCRPSVQQSPSVAGSPGLGSFFCESPAQPMMPAAKRRNVVSSPASPSSSPSSSRRAPRAGEKAVSTNNLFLGGSRAGALAARRRPNRTRPYVQPIQTADGARAAASVSAAPIMCGPMSQRNSIPGMRRVHSVCDPVNVLEGSDTEDEFEASPSVRMPRVDGSPKHRARPSLGRLGQFKSVGMVQTAVPSSHSVEYDDNERAKKILPCHPCPKAGSDILMRITPDTLQDVLAGKYDDRMKKYYVLDCRFGYEYEGGHIDGAINVQNAAQLDELFLSGESGIHAENGSLPPPSRSGELGESQQVVLIFHCEFSEMRAPKAALDFRRRDRQHVGPLAYPKIIYPEIYILQGGYKEFYEQCPSRCEPRAYVNMHHPDHADKCESALHKIRRQDRNRAPITRALSYTYGDRQSARMLPPCGPLSLAAGSAAQGRRGNAEATGPDTVAEELDADSSFEGTGSPCPRALSIGRAPFGQSTFSSQSTFGGQSSTFGHAVFGSARPRALQMSGNRVFQRTASCADAMGRQ